MKYFNEKYLTAENIAWLKRSRKELAYGKILEFENGIYEVYDFEKPVFVKKRNDSLLEYIERLQEGEYDFKTLPKELRDYMKQKDSEFFNKAYRDYQKSKETDISARNELQLLGNIDVSYDEFMEYWNGRKKIHSTPLWKKVNDSTRRTYKTVNDLIRANLDKLDVFVTLTFARKENAEKYEDTFEFVENSKDFKEVKKAYTTFMNNLSHKVKRSGGELYYITVFERHKDGSYHFHVIMNDIGSDYIKPCPEWLDYDYKRKCRRYGYLLNDWNYGKSDYDRIQDKNRMSSYLCKYLTKTILNLTNDERAAQEILGAKRYFASRNLKRPTLKYDDNIKQLTEILKKEYADTYSREYQNYYNKGTITKTIFSNPL